MSDEMADAMTNEGGLPDPADQTEDEMPGVPAPDPGLRLDPVNLFLINFDQVMREFKQASGAGQSIKAPNLTTLVQEAAKYAAHFTQIELDMVFRGSAASMEQGK